MNTITNALSVRSNDTWELCAAEPATTAFTVSPKSSERIDNQVALCNTCCSALDQKDADVHWQWLAGTPEGLNKIFTGWVVTNTNFTKDAIT